MKFTLQDLTAAIVAIVLCVGSVALAILQRPFPPELNVALGSALTWVFVRSMAGSSAPKGPPP